MKDDRERFEEEVPFDLTAEEKERLSKIHVQDDRKWHFTIIENAILENEKITYKGVLTYTALCYYANSKDHSCFPSIKTLAEIARLSESSIKRGIKELNELGIVDIHYRKDPDNPKKNLSNLYTIKGVGSEGTQDRFTQAPGVDSERPSNNNNKELEPINDNNSAVALFKKTFSCTLPEDVLLNPHLKQSIDYMVELKDPVEVNNPVGLLIHLLRNPQGIPLKDPDPMGTEKQREDAVKRRRDNAQAAKDREQQAKDPEQVKKIHEMVKDVCGQIPAF